MAARNSFHSQLSSIIVTMATSAVSQVCKLVDEDSAELRLELSRLLFANSALTEKVNSLECELTIVRSDASKLCKSSRTVGVQTTCYTDCEPLVSGSPAIEGIFGKDWCMNLWKDRDLYNLEQVTDSPQSFDKSLTTLSDEITLTEIKEEDYVVDTARRFQQDTLSKEAEREDNLLEAPEQLSVGYSAGSSPCSPAFEQVIEESSLQLISINGTEQSPSTHIIPIEDDDKNNNEDDDVQFVQESQQQPTMNAAGWPNQNKQQTLQADNNEVSASLDKDSQSDIKMPNVKHVRGPNKEKFKCQICSRAFFHKGSLTHHIKSHKSNFCNICKQHFPLRDKLNSHNCMPPVLSQRVAKSCELCGKTFANPSALKIHNVVHTGEKPYRCSLCGKGFTQKGNLKCHTRLHTGERPFQCVKCGKTFTQKVNLNHHLRAHKNREFKGEKPLTRRYLKNLMVKN